MKTVSQIRDELADREAIRDVILRYCRASDRADEDLLRSVYWPDAQDDHLEFSGDAEAFVAYSIPILRAMRYNMHKVGNMLIAIDGNRAEVESYFHAYHSIDTGEGRRDSFSGGRYLDVLEKRNDVWRILKRFVTVEWFRDLPDTADWDTGPFGMRVARGDLKPADKSYEFFSFLD
ncbi:MAG TPA: nuclear transport factor 2 family protein [Porticoccaceae bacterium]